MKTHLRYPAIAFFLFAACALYARKEADLVTAVHSRTANGYQRSRTADGGFKPEYFAIANGGPLPGTTLETPMEQVGFPRLAGVLGQHLATQNYFLAPNEASAELLLVVYWGATGQTTSTLDTTLRGAMNGTNGEDIQLLQEMRDRITFEHAKLLGYAEELHKHDDIRRSMNQTSSRYNELWYDVVEPRFYVIVAAYDFRETVVKKNKKLLWMTRVSIRSPRNSFAQEFSPMLAKAARTFGQNPGLLRREQLEARVEIGELEVVGPAPESAAKPAK